MTHSLSLEEQQQAIDSCLRQPWHRLRLDPPLHALFEEETAAGRNRHLRFYLALGMALMVACLALDATVGRAQLELGLVGRVGIVVPLHLAALVLASRRFAVAWQGAAAIAAMLSSVVVTTLLGIQVGGQIGDRYIMAAGLLAFTINLVAPLRLRHAALFSLSSALLLPLLVLWASGAGQAAQSVDLVAFLSAMILVTFAIAYRRELANKRAFLLGLRDRLLGEQLRLANARLEHLSNTDALTGLPNRRYFTAALDRAWQASLASGSWLGVMMVDVDHFKLFNDALGHAAGDECLKRIAATIRAQVDGEGDIVARYGGEEFVVVLPGRSTGDSLAFGEKLRLSVQDLALNNPGLAAGTLVTVSIGIAAAIPQTGSTPELLLRCADRALYSAKADGRNAVALGDFARAMGASSDAFGAVQAKPSGARWRDSLDEARRAAG